MNAIIRNIVPENVKGKRTDVEHTITFDDRLESIEAFKRAYKRMFNINIWHELIGFASAHFSLVDPQGLEIRRLAKLHDYVRINIPGPGPSLGNGYDWVHLEAVEVRINPESPDEAVAMRMRSCKNPHKDSDVSAHFFTTDATSTIIIERRNDTVSASFHGRNEILNTDTNSIKDNIRNALIGSGAMIGLSELQWATLIKSLLKKEV